LKDRESDEVGESGHAAELAEGPFPGTGFTFDHGRGGEALEGVDEEGEKGERDEGREERRAVGPFGIGDGFAHRFGLVAIGGVGNGEAADEDFAGGEGQSKKEALFGSYQVNAELLTHCADDHLVLHCLPAYREKEITEEILELHSDTIFQQAENRLHAQKAVLARIDPIDSLLRTTL